MSKKSFKETTTLFAVTSTSTRDYCTATLSALEVVGYTPRGDYIVREMRDVLAVGTARKDPEDKYNDTIGINLAVGRAIHSMGTRMIKRTNGLVKHFDDIKNMRATAKKRSQGKHPSHHAGQQPIQEGHTHTSGTSTPSTAISPQRVGAT